jgi:hypothetical protein
MTTTHRCPHCRCLPDGIDDIGAVNTDAPFYPLIEMICELYGDYERIGAGRNHHRTAGPRVAAASTRAGRSD